MDYNAVTQYKNVMNENIFSCMEMTKQSYIDIMSMPIKRFNDFIKWKAKLEEDKQKAMDDELSKIKK